MGWIIFLLFTAVPITEMYLLFTVGGYIGFLPTVLCVMLTAVIGVTLLRWQGIATLQRGMGRVSAGELPGQEIAEGMMLAVSGALLLTPGFITDTIGFLLLVPPVRAVLAAYAGKHLKVVNAGPGMSGFGGGPGQNSPFGSGPGQPSPGARPGTVREKRDGSVVIEGEYEEKDPS